MEYQLFSEEVKKSLPHIVIWAHAPNDSQEADKAAVEYQSIPAFVHAARSLRMCDEELPLVVMVSLSTLLAYIMTYLFAYKYVFHLAGRFLWSKEVYGY